MPFWRIISWPAVVALDTLPQLFFQKNNQTRSCSCHGQGELAGTWMMRNLGNMASPIEGRMAGPIVPRFRRAGYAPMHLFEAGQRERLAAQVDFSGVQAGEQGQGLAVVTRVDEERHLSMHADGAQRAANGIEYEGPVLVYIH